MPDQFDFETDFLNLNDFLNAIREAELFAIFRPGPYICAEWDFGGLPSWLLRDPNMKIRSNYSPYLDAVDNYWRSLFDIAKHFQFSLNGGPIIAVQIENEFGSYGNTKTNKSDAIYMKTLGDIAYKHGMRELFITSDGPGRHGSLDSQTKMSRFLLKKINYYV